MVKNNFQIEWDTIAREWGLSVVIPFALNLKSGPISVPVLLRDFGGSKGMLLVTDYDLIAPYADELIDLNFGFSCLSVPVKPYDPKIDNAALLELFQDWGWAGSGTPPEWLSLG